MADTKKEKTHGAENASNFQKIYRSETNRVIAGVAGGLGDFFNIDPTIIRIIFIILTVFGGSGLIIYIILWLVIPSQSALSHDSQETIRSNIQEMKSRTTTFAHSVAGPGANRENSRFWWAVGIIILGFLFLMNNFGLLDSYELHRYWPLILIIFGLAIILRK